MKVVIEVGMNDGTDTARYLDCDDMVLYGFEPTNAILAKLYKRFENDPRVNIIPLAVDGQNRFTDFNIGTFGHLEGGCNSLYELNMDDEYIANDTSVRFSSKQKVTTIRLDSFCDLYNISKIDYIHIDAQGSDFNVLKSLGKYINVVQEGIIEAAYNVSIYKDVDNTHTSICNWLTDNGFVYELAPDWLGREANIHFKRA